jgi:hypothetical protein
MSRFDATRAIPIRFVSLPTVKREAERRARRAAHEGTPQALEGMARIVIERSDPIDGFSPAAASAAR